MAPERLTYSIVIPVFNEEESLPELRRRLMPVVDGLDGAAEIVFVDDGSRDRTAAMIEEMHTEDPRIKLVRFSRNFGHQIAVTAGLDFTTGDAVIVMDADLQDPPELLPEMIGKWRSGVDVVYGVRTRRDHESRLMTKGREAFYRLLNRIAEVDIPLDAGDFRLIDRRVLDGIGHLREYNRYVRGLCAWVGFRHAEVEYDRPGRHAGESKYPIFMLVKLGLAGITGFSKTPLHLVLYLGLGMAGLSMFGALVALLLWAFKPGVVEGWTSVVIVLTFLGGTQLFALGIIADYVGRIFDEVKNRPIYVVGATTGFDTERPAIPRMAYCPPREDRPA